MAIAIGGEAGSAHRTSHDTSTEAEGATLRVRTQTASPAQGPKIAIRQHAPPRPRAAHAPAPFYKAVPTTAPYTLRPALVAPAARGYARSTATARPAPPAAAKSSSAKTTSTKATATKSASKSTSASSKKELAFLDDKHLSIEDKLFQFMALMTKKTDADLEQAMKDYDAKKTAASSSTAKSSAGQAKSSSGSSSSSSGLLGQLGDALGGIGKTLVGAAEAVAKQVGGPALAAVAAAVGLPALAPLALKFGGDLAATAVEGFAGAVGLLPGSHASSSAPAASTGGSGSGSKSSSSSSSASKAPAGAEAFDEKLEMLKLERLVDKQKEMFGAISNTLKAMHDAQMIAIGNIR